MSFITQLGMTLELGDESEELLALRALGGFEMPIQVSTDLEFSPVQLLTSLVVSFDQLFELGYCCFVRHVRMRVSQ
jgi:hypothetical protein